MIHKSRTRVLLFYFHFFPPAYRVLPDSGEETGGDFINRGSLQSRLTADWQGSRQTLLINFLGY